MSNLSRAQFLKQQAVEDKQRRRFFRKRESGFVGTGFWFWNYPYMIGGVGAGTIVQTPDKPTATNDGSYDPGNTSGMGEGGTAASATGAAGGSPA